MAIDFDPNSRRVKQYVWATYIRDRSPQFKSYYTLGHAKQSLYRHYTDMVLYRLDDDGKWQEVIQYSPPEFPSEWTKDGGSAFLDERGRAYRTFKDQLSEIKA